MDAQTREQLRMLIDGLRRDLAGGSLGNSSGGLRLPSAQDCPTCGGRHNTDVHLARARGLQVGDDIMVVNDAAEFQATITGVHNGMVYFRAPDPAAIGGGWNGSEPARNCYR